jgi:hypothetical protein
VAGASRREYRDKPGGLLVIVIGLALAGAGPLAAKEYRSREVTREFQRQHELEPAEEAEIVGLIR